LKNAPAIVLIAASGGTVFSGGDSRRSFPEPRKSTKNVAISFAKICGRSLMIGGPG
jgi:hypothetical protein